MFEFGIKRIGIVCGYPFPYGLASTTRILTYCRGFKSFNVRPDIFIYFPTDQNSSELLVSGELNEIHYHYPGTRKYPRFRLFRILSHPYYCIIAMYKLYMSNRRQKFDYVIISSDWLRILYSFVPLINLMGSKPLFIVDEYPVPIRTGKENIFPKWRKMLFRIILKHVYGMIFMTSSLADFYNRIISKPGFILPTITDVSRFDISTPRQKVICYMGSMDLSKDNIVNIIEAFSIISMKYADFELHLYGSPNINDYKALMELISKLNLSSRIILKGTVANTEVPVILKSSSVLVSSSVVSKRTEGGFPTKIGEYLATGVPTVLTNIGSISKFIRDGIHAWFAEPDNPTDFADKLDLVLGNYEDALLIGLNAKQFIVETYDYKIQSFKLLTYLDSILNK